MDNHDCVMMASFTIKMELDFADRNVGSLKEKG